jgi:anaerobic selenocysteine-containing dehydrogenase
MTNKKDATLAASTEATTQAPESANRRSFMKGMAAGTLAAGTLAGTVVSAGAKNAGQEAAQGLGDIPQTVKPRRATATMRVSFSQKRRPNLDDIFRVLKGAFDETGCTYCGLGGVDVILRLDEIINPQVPAVVLVEGELPGV